MHEIAARFPRQAVITADVVLRWVCLALLIVMAAYVAAEVHDYTRAADALALAGR